MKKLSLGLLSGVFAAVLLATPAFAWHFALKGTGLCQPDGSYKISWEINNQQWDKPLKITQSSNIAVVPVNTVIPKYGVQNFDQTADGTQKANYSLKLTGYWDLGHNKKEFWTATAKADLCQACDQPQQPPVDNPTDNPPADNPVTPPAAGGLGGGTPDTVATSAAPQVVAPVGAVNAGQGGAPKKVVSTASIVGLIGSASAVGFGLRGLKKRA
jgi:hypothetical protein